MLLICKILIIRPIACYRTGRERYHILPGFENYFDKLWVKLLRESNLRVKLIYEQLESDLNKKLY